MAPALSALTLPGPRGRAGLGSGSVFTLCVRKGAGSDQNAAAVGAPWPWPPPSGCRVWPACGASTRAHRGQLGPSGIGQGRAPVFRAEGLAVHLHVCLSGSSQCGERARGLSHLQPSARPALRASRKPPLCEHCFRADAEVAPARHTCVPFPAVVPLHESLCLKHCLIDDSSRARTALPACVRWHHVFPR